MKRLSFISLFLSISALLNSGITNELPKNKSNAELIKEQIYKLKEVVDNQIEIDIFLIKTNMYNKFSFENKLKITKICKELGIENEIWLYKTIFKESRGNTKAINKKSMATGIIQWLPSTAKSLGVTVDSIYNMNMNQQLDYVYKYYEPICKKHKINSYLKTYLAVFHPLSLNKGKNHIIGNENSIITKLNPIDVNKDRVITVEDISNFIKI